MQDILSLRGQMQTVSKAAACSIEFMPGDEVQLWWVDGAKSFNATISIPSLSIAILKTFRPILPKPLIAIFIIIPPGIINYLFNSILRN